MLPYGDMGAAGSPMAALVQEVKKSAVGAASPSSSSPTTVQPLALLEALPAAHAGLIQKRLFLHWSRPKLAQVKSHFLVVRKGSTVESPVVLVVNLAGAQVARASAGRSVVLTIKPTDSAALRLRIATPEAADAWVDVISSVVPTRSLADFAHVESIGSGGYGRVSVVQDTSSGALYAMKVVPLDLSNARAVEHAIEERAALERLDSPFTTKLHFAFQEDNHLHYVQALGTVDLHDATSQQPGHRFNEDVVRVMAAELVLAVEHMHSRHIVHRDLKLENLLLTDDGHVMVADFGLALRLGPFERTRSFAGTTRYVPPEMWTGAGYNKSVDFWQLGCVLYELLVGTVPFNAKDEDKLERSILSGTYRMPEFLSSEAASLIRGLLTVSVEHRLGCGHCGIATLKAHPFFAGIEWDAVARKAVQPSFVPGPRRTDVSRAVPLKVRAEGNVSSESGPAASPRASSAGSPLLGFDFAPRVVHISA